MPLLSCNVLPVHCTVLPCCRPRAARQELQRLESSVSKSERLAGAVLADLRSMRQNPRATELRSEVGSDMVVACSMKAVLEAEP